MGVCLRNGGDEVRGWCGWCMWVEVYRLSLEILDNLDNFFIKCKIASTHTRSR